MSSQYYYRSGDAVHGPVSARELKQLASEGKLAREAEVSTDREHWTPAGAIGGLEWPAPTAGPPGPAAMPPPAPPIPAGPPPGPRNPGRRRDRYDVFVSYKRRDGSEVARVIADKLEARGFHVFLDVEKLGSGRWDRELADRIDECPDFVPIITDAYFSGCQSPDDVVRQEVHRALSQGKNVIPLLAVRQGPDFPADLPPDIQAIGRMNGIRYVHEYSEGVVSKLCEFLTARPLRGPEVLRQGAARDRVIVSTPGFVLGVWRGASSGAMAGGDGWISWGVSFAFLNGLFWGVATTAAIGIPLVFLLGWISHRWNLRRDELYLGPWIPFWAIYLPATMVLASVIPVALFNAIGFRSFFWGGILGGLTAFGVTALFSLTDLWSVVHSAFSTRKR